MEHACLVWFLWFHQVCPWCLLCLGPLSVSVLCSPAEVNLRTIRRRQLLHISVPCRQPDLASSYTVVNSLSFRQWSYPIQRVRPKDGVTWELHSGFGEYWFIPHSCPSISLDNLLYREDFPVYTRGRHDLSSIWVYRPKSWRLEGVRIRILNRMYPDEKPPSLSVLMHGCSLVTRKPTWHLLTMPYILVRIGAPYEGWWPTPFHLPRNYGTIFEPKIFKY